MRTERLGTAFTAMVFVVIVLIVVAAIGASLVTQSSGRTTSTLDQPLSILGIAMGSTNVGGEAGNIGINIQLGKIYVGDLFERKLTVVDAVTHSLEGTIVLPGMLEGDATIVVNPETNMVYVPVFGNQSEIVEINGSTDSVVGSIPSDAIRIAIDPATDTLFGIYGTSTSFVANGSGYLVTIDGRTGAVLSKTAFPGDPMFIAANPGTDDVYVEACRQSSLACSGAEMLTFRGDSGKLQSNVSLPYIAESFGLALDETTNTVYTIGGSLSNLTVVSINGTSGNELYSRNIGSSCSGAGGGEIAFDSLTNQVYAAFTSWTYFLILDASTGQLVNILNTPQNATFDVKIDPVTQQAFLTTGDKLVAIPTSITQSYVNTRLLQNGVCIP